MRKGVTHTAADGRPDGAPELAPIEWLRLKKLRVQALLVAFLIFALDQALKWLVTYPLDLRGRPEGTITITDFFSLRWVENNGVSLSLLSASNFWGRWLLVLPTGAIAAFVVFWLWKARRRVDSVALAVVLGGALGNILDRIRLGTWSIILIYTWASFARFWFSMPPMPRLPWECCSCFCARFRWAEAGHRKRAVPDGRHTAAFHP